MCIQVNLSVLYDTYTVSLCRAVVPWDSWIHKSTRTCPGMHPGMYKHRGMCVHRDAHICAIPLQQLPDMLGYAPRSSGEKSLPGLSLGLQCRLLQDCFKATIAY